VTGARYGRTVKLGRYRGVVFLEHAPRGSQILLDLSLGLLPVLMPLIARLRRVCDLDAEPAVIDAHLASAGLGELVRQNPGLRMPVAFDGFEAAVLELVGAGTPALGAVVEAAAEKMETGWPGLTHVGLTPSALASLGARELAALGVPGPRAEALAAVARAGRDSLRLEPGAEPAATLETLRRTPGIDSVLATAIVMRAMHWPDAFDAEDAELQHHWGAADARELADAAEAWRPWRAHAAAYLRASAGQRPGSAFRAVT